MTSDNELETDDIQQPQEGSQDGLTEPDQQETHCDKCANKLGNQWNVQCSVCNSWLHKTCTDLVLEDVKYLKKVKKRDGVHTWACAKCSVHLKALRDNMVRIERKDNKNTKIRCE